MRKFPCYCSNLQHLRPALLCPAPRGAPAPPHVLRGSDTPRGSSPRLIRAGNCFPDPTAWGGERLAASPTGGQGALRAPCSLPRVPVSPPPAQGLPLCQPHCSCRDEAPTRGCAVLSTASFHTTETRKPPRAHRGGHRRRLCCQPGTVLPPQGDAELGPPPRLEAAEATEGAAASSWPRALPRYSAITGHAVAPSQTPLHHAGQGDTAGRLPEGACGTAPLQDAAPAPGPASPQPREGHGQRCAGPKSSDPPPCEPVGPCALQVTIRATQRWPCHTPVRKAVCPR